MGGIPSWAVKGAKVVCIRDDWETLPGIHREPMLNEVLTISFAEMAVGASDTIEEAGFAFEEIPLRQRHDGGRSLWCATCFRPLVTRTQEQDLEQFLPLLDEPLLRIPHHGEIA